MTNSTIQKLQRLKHRRARIRSRVNGTPERPRLSVRVSQLHIVAQLIDDTTGRTLIYTTTVGSKAKGTMTERAAWTGEQIATRAKAKKIKKAVFDRGGRLYHGRLHTLAEAARDNGLEF